MEDAAGGVCLTELHCSITWMLSFAPVAALAGEAWSCKPSQPFPFLVLHSVAVPLHH